MRQVCFLVNIEIDFFSDNLAFIYQAMLGGSLVTTTWRDLGLQMEEMASGYGG
jgi:hypothetical protein